MKKKAVEHVELTNDIPAEKFLLSPETSNVLNLERFLVALKIAANSVEERDQENLKRLLIAYLSQYQLSEMVNASPEEQSFHVKILHLIQDIGYLDFVFVGTNFPESSALSLCKYALEVYAFGSFQNVKSNCEYDVEDFDDDLFLPDAKKYFNKLGKAKRDKILNAIGAILAMNSTIEKFFTKEFYLFARHFDFNCILQAVLLRCLLSRNGFVECKYILNDQHIGLQIGNTPLIFDTFGDDIRLLKDFAFESGYDDKYKGNYGVRTNESSYRVSFKNFLPKSLVEDDVPNPLRKYDVLGEILCSIIEHKIFDSNEAKIPQYEFALKVAPNNRTVVSNLAMRLVESGDLDGAKKLVYAVSKHCPTDPFVRLWKAYFVVDSNLPRAIRILTDLDNDYPFFFNAKYNLICAFINKGDFKSARRAFNELMEFRESPMLAIRRTFSYNLTDILELENLISDRENTVD